MNNLTRDLRDTIIMIILFLALLYALPLDAADYDIWYKYPDGKYWHQCVEIADSGGVGPVTHYIPEGAIIAIRDRGKNVLIPITRGR